MNGHLRSSAALVFLAACAHAPAPSEERIMSVTTKELGRAVELAEKEILASGAVVAELKLTSAINLMDGRSYRGPAYWRLTFKRRDLLPKDAESELGAGGELFLEVDLDAGSAKITGRGE
jgi:hypothetical protein